MTKLILIILFSIFIDSAYSQEKKEIINTLYPRKICPSIKNRYWNITKVTKSKDLKTFCSKKIFKPLSEFIGPGAKCEIFPSYLICSHKKRRIKAKLCVGVSNVENFTPSYDLNYKCPRTPINELTKLVNPEAFDCFVKNQGILCFPKKFNAKVTYGGEVQILNVDCPKGVEAYGNIDRVYCYYKNEVNNCDEPAFLSRHKGRVVCKEIRDYFVHIKPISEKMKYSLKLQDEIKKRDESYE